MLYEMALAVTDFGTLSCLQGAADGRAGRKLAAILVFQGLRYLRPHILSHVLGSYRIGRRLVKPGKALHKGSSVVWAIAPCVHF